MVDMSMLSMDSKEDCGHKTSTTSVVVTDYDRGSVGEYSDSCCDNGSSMEVSSVAHLREWLDDFGKHSKDHYQKNAAIGKAPSNVHLEKPVRPKVSRSSMSVPRTPLPFNVANALSKRRVTNPNTSYSGTASLARTATARTTSRNLSRRKSTGMPLHVNKNHYHHHHPRITTTAAPVIYKAKLDNHQDVQATDQGYASVAKLSAWLADDPTRTKKKVRQIRRGANIIAKSRAFDKGLADVIVEQTNIRNGHVAGKKEDWMMKLETMTRTTSTSLSSHEPSTRTESLENEDNGEPFASPSVKKNRSMDDECMSTVNVANKMKWLSSAFKKEDSDTMCEGFSVPKKARTDFITARDERDDLSNRAKQLWRNKRSPMKENAQRPHADMKHQLTPAKINPIASGVTTTTTTPKSAVSLQSSDFPNKTNSVTDVFANLSIAEQQLPADLEDTRTPTETTNSLDATLNFHSARQLLVERSKASGSSVKVASKVQRSKAKYERLRQNAIHLAAPNGLLKASWETDENGPSSGCGSYVKTFAEDHPHPKSLHDLP